MRYIKGNKGKAVQVRTGPEPSWSHPHALAPLTFPDLARRINPVAPQQPLRIKPEPPQFAPNLLVWQNLISLVQRNHPVRSGKK